MAADYQNKGDRLTLAEELFIAGRSYVTSAHAIVKSQVRQRYGNDRRFIFPTAMLVAHAVEVYLKAWLAEQDATFTRKRLKDEYGHSLTALYEAVSQRGFSDAHAEPEQSYQDLIESLAQGHSQYSFRYPYDGWSFGVPKNDVLFSILKRLDAQIAHKVGGSLPENLDWTVGENEDFRSSTP